MRLLDKGGMAALTTNAVAAAAGVSIGSLYQYFPNKEAILEALGDREVGHLGDRATAALMTEEKLSPDVRIRALLRAFIGQV